MITCTFVYTVNNKKSILLTFLCEITKTFLSENSFKVNPTFFFSVYCYALKSIL